MRAYLAGAISTYNPDSHVFYKTINFKGEESKPAAVVTGLNGTTPVTILQAAPNIGTVQVVNYVSIYNKDSSSVTVTVATYDGTTERILLKHQLLTTESLNWTPNLGWFVI